MRRASLALAVAGLLLALSIRPVGGQATDDVVARAMADELARSMSDLHEGQLGRPYFIAYAMHDVDSRSASASGGSLLGRRTGRSRLLSIEVRVGDYTFDNSGGGMNFAALGAALGALGGSEIPIDDDYHELRRQIWLATDAAYKQAAEGLASKKTALMNRASTDTLADFWRVPATHTVDESATPPVTDADIESMVRTASAAGKVPNILLSSAAMVATTVRTHYVNSEGTTYVRSQPLLSLTASASTQAVDGMPLGDGLVFYARTLKELPAADIAARVRSMALRLDSLRLAPLFDRYNGPVLFEGRGAAELFESRFASALTGRRRLAMGSDGMAGSGSLGDKIGGRVLPEFLSVTDDPTRTGYGKVSLLGTYKVDDEGVAARGTPLVENGILKSVLTNRTPVDGVDHSTGNDRGGTAGPSNLIVTAANGVSEHDLRVQLLAMAAKRGLPYAVVVRDLGGVGGGTGQDQIMAMIMRMGGRGSGGQSLLAVYRLYPDGREQLVRAAQLADFSLTSFKDITAASQTASVYHEAGGGMGGAMAMLMSMMARQGVSFGSTAVSSYVVPSLLFDDVTLLRAPHTLPDLPFSPPPEGTQ